MKKYVILLVIGFTYSCSTLKSDYKIVNNVLNIEKKNVPIKLGHINYNGLIELLIYNYQNDIKVYKFSKTISDKYFFENGQELSVNLQDINEMRSNFGKQRNIIWNKEFLKNDSITLRPYEEVKVLSKKRLPFVYLSRPLYNNSKKKAIINYFEANSSRCVLYFLIQENNNWKIVGRMEHDMSPM